jgi:hypothetical protein
MSFNEDVLKLLRVYRGVGLNFPPLERKDVLMALKAIASQLSLPLHSLSLETLRQHSTLTESGLYYLENLPLLLKELRGWDKMQVMQWLVEQLANAASKDQYFVFLNHEGETLSESLYSLIPVKEWPLPDLREIKGLISNYSSFLLSASCPLPSETLAVTVAGLSKQEIRKGLELMKGEKDLKRALMDYKREQLGKIGLEFLSIPKMKEMGGLDRIKEAIEKVAIDYSPQARQHNIPFPKGWLMVGPPGTGKTFTAKVCAAKLGFPLISVGIDLVKSKGSNYLKGLLQRIEQASPAVCYFDEFDKFFDPETAITGGGSSKETLGVLLTWLQEKQSQTFVIATLNRLNALPPELTRAGRFDRIFYVGFPSPIERYEIIKLHAANYDGRFLDDTVLETREWRILLSRTQNCTGAELQAIVETAARQQYYHFQNTELTLENLLLARQTITPLFARDPERILAMENRARYVSEPASLPDQSIFAPPEQDLWGEKKVVNLR